MPDYFLVRETCGPAWDHTRGRREQDGWDEHAVFMDKLVEDGFVFLGGPIGDVNSGDPLLVVEAEERPRSGHGSPRILGPTRC
jgi:hypothetical protein